MLAVLENFQDEGGRVSVPEVLEQFGAPREVLPGA
jgi:seryl-tRNA synthetase